jgi:hypothetical protein
MDTAQVDLRTGGWPITLLTPSRGRYKSLAFSIWSARRMATDESRIKAVVVADPDDMETVQVAAELRCRAIVAPERFGYAGLHEYYNLAAAAAEPGWLVVWNDDASMLTPGWDDVVACQPPGVLWPAHNDPNHDHCNLFPIWPSVWTKATGRVAADIHVDSWLQEIGTGLGLQWRVPFNVWHARTDVTGDHQDQTWEDSQGQRQHSGEFYSAAMDSARRADIEKIRETL